MSTTEYKTVNVRAILDAAVATAGLSAYERSVAAPKIERVATALQARVDNAVGVLRTEASRQGLAEQRVNGALTRSGLVEEVTVPDPEPVAAAAQDESPVSIIDRVIEGLSALRGRFTS